jgi:hypothetical protein
VPQLSPTHQFGIYHKEKGFVMDHYMDETTPENKGMLNGVEEYVHRLDEVLNVLEKRLAGVLRPSPSSERDGRPEPGEALATPQSPMREQAALVEYRARRAVRRITELIDRVDL